MKNIKMKLITWIGLLAVCLLPAGAHAQHLRPSGILGQLESPGEYNLIGISDGRKSISVQIDEGGSFEEDLNPGYYVLTPCLVPVVGPGQAYPNLFLKGPSIRVRVSEHHYTVVEIPAQRALPIAPATHQGS